MACSHPLLAVNLGKDENGKNRLKILTRIDDFSTIEDAKKKYQLFGHELMLLPCGKCPGCMKKRRKEWMLRCYFESTYHNDNSFITLTYDDDHLVKTPDKWHYQCFIQELRNLGFKFKYFGCCERGSKNFRIHFHIILFGFRPDDLKPSHKSQSGFMCYTSELLTKVWNKGLVVVNDFTPETAAYVAGYCDKKLTNPDDDSFIFMSTKPAIGREYIEANLEKLIEYDNVILPYANNSKPLNLPRYVSKVAESKNVNLDTLKSIRLSSSQDAIYKAMRQFGSKSYREYFDRVLQNEIDLLKRRVRGL